ncbi:MAG: glyoxalase/bleomycin resistance/extradiol dioxygenase family protein, partial [Pedobacter sp.]
MNPKKIWANLAVKDVARTSDFYTKLGFRQNGKPNADLTSFLFGETGFVIHFFVESKLKDAIEGPLADLKQGNEIIFT